ATFSSPVDPRLEAPESFRRGAIGSSAAGVHSARRPPTAAQRPPGGGRAPGGAGRRNQGRGVERAAGRGKNEEEKNEEKRKGKARWKRNWPPQPRARLGQWLLDRAPWRTAAGGNLPGEEEEGEKEEEEEEEEETRSTDACAPGRRGPEAQSLGSGAPPHLCSRRQAAMKRCHLDPQEVRRQRLGGLRRT
ncbi:unnamed protein product, partial [Prorocentrum cordatum]